MKLASRNDGTRDGALVVVNRSLSHWTDASTVCATLRQAMDEWDVVAPQLQTLSEQLHEGKVASTAFDAGQFKAPLPRAAEWVDGSAYLNHVILVRKARNAEVPPTLKTDPLVYQGGSSDLSGPRQDIVIADEAWGCDFESEVCVVLGDVPMGTTVGKAAPLVRLVMLANDVSLRNLIPNELAKGFGFFQSKPSTAFSPVAVTPDELGSHWKDGRLHLRLHTWLNGAAVGSTDAGPEMHFSFFELVAHIAKTRNFSAGTILGSGTVSNVDRARGVSCLQEIRMIETIETGSPQTPFMKHGDTVEIDMLDERGHSIFGRISQRVRVQR
jgi:fumarylacetoacetate (FAA) hydrolase